jgi:hypothetical protein
MRSNNEFRFSQEMYKRFHPQTKTMPATSTEKKITKPVRRGGAAAAPKPKPKPKVVSKPKTPAAASASAAVPAPVPAPVPKPKETPAPKSVEVPMPTPVETPTTPDPNVVDDSASPKPPVGNNKRVNKKRKRPEKKETNNGNKEKKEKKESGVKKNENEKNETPEAPPKRIYTLKPRRQLDRQATLEKYRGRIKGLDSESFQEIEGAFLSDYNIHRINLDADPPEHHGIILMAEARQKGVNILGLTSENKKNGNYVYPLPNSSKRVEEGGDARVVYIGNNVHGKHATSKVFCITKDDRVYQLPTEK